MKNNNCKINLQNDCAINNILVEVCLGLKINNFEEKIGARKEVVIKLLEKLSEEEKLGVIETYLTPSEVAILKKAFKVVKEEIEEWDFHTRIGSYLNEVENLPIFQEPN